MKLEEQFKKEYMYFGLEGNNFEELTEHVSEILWKKNLIEDTYLDALMKREEEYPTGLITKFLNIGLPHTDSEHIKKPFVFIVRTNKPINVKQMGDNQEMRVENFFFLGITKPTEQVELLQIIMNLFMDDNFVSDFKECPVESKCFELIKNKLNLKEDTKNE